MPTNIIKKSAAALLLTLFLYTACEKLAHHGAFTASVTFSPLTGGWPSLFSTAIPVAELIVALLLFFPRSLMAGLYSSAILLSGFTVYIVYMLAFARNLPCSCGGVISSLSWKQHLIFNLFFLGLAVLAILSG
eukprot:gene68815-94305_t